MSSWMPHDVSESNPCSKCGATSFHRLSCPRIWTALIGTAVGFWLVFGLYVIIGPKGMVGDVELPGALIFGGGLTMAALASLLLWLRARDR